MQVRKAAAAAGAAALFVSLLPGPAAGHSDGPSHERRARVATRYLVASQNDDGSWSGFSGPGSTADAIQALVAARRAPGAIHAGFDYLEDALAGSTAGQKAKVVLALLSRGRNPRRFGGRNLVAGIKRSMNTEGRYVADGDFTPVTTQALSMLALASAGADVAPEAVTWLLDAQCDGGGWQYNAPAGADGSCGSSEDFTNADTNTSAYAVMALSALPGAFPDVAKDVFPFFRSARDPVKGGYVYEPAGMCTGGERPDGTWPDCFLTDANSTGLVIQALRAKGRDLPAGVVHALSHLQYDRFCGEAGGAFAFSWVEKNGKLRRTPSRAAAANPDTSQRASSIGATIDGVLGVLRESQPVSTREVTEAAPVLPDC